MVPRQRPKQRRTHDYMRGRRQVRKAEPADVVVFIRSEVRWHSLPVRHEPGAEDSRLVNRSRRQTAQVERRACRDLHAQFLVQLPRERFQF